MPLRGFLDNARSLCSLGKRDVFALGDNALAYYQDNSTVVMMPHEATQAAGDKVNRSLQHAVRPLTNQDSIESSINYHANVAGVLVDAASQSYETVSTDFDIGVHTADGLIGIGRGRVGEPFQLKLEASK